MQAFKGFLFNSYEANGLKLSEPAKIQGYDQLKKSLSKKWDAADHPGCLVYGYVWVNKVPGRLQIEAKSGYQDLDATMTNMSHVVNHVGFGTQLARRHRRKLER